MFHYNEININIAIFCSREILSIILIDCAILTVICFLVRFWGENQYKHLKKKRPYLAAYLDYVLFHQDNVPAHTSQITQSEIDLLVLECLPHPPYSPDLALMDFAVFPYIKSFLQGQRFKNLQKMRQGVLNIISRMQPEQFVRIFQDWVKQNKKCVELNGDYVDNLIFILFSV